MTILDPTSGSSREDWRRDDRRDEWQMRSQQLRRTAADERRKSERLASQLSREALQQLQRSIEGMLAMPTAAALGIGSVTLYAAAFLERGFEVLQQSTEAIRNGVMESRREMERPSSDSDGRRLRERLEGPQQNGMGDTMQSRSNDAIAE